MWRKILNATFLDFFPQIRPTPFASEIELVVTAEEHLAELMPIFEQLRAQGDLPCTYPLHVSSSAFGTAFIRGGSRSTPLSPHAPHCHPASHWVSWNFSEPLKSWPPVKAALSKLIRPCEQQTRPLANPRSDETDTNHFIFVFLFSGENYFN